MSQTFAIKRVRHSGVPVYIGEVDGVDTWTSNPERIVRWLCDGWRSRFNQHRAWRAKSVWEDDPDNPGHQRRVTDSQGQPILMPLGDVDRYLTDAEARKRCSWLAAIPSLVLAAPERIENTEWWAANARRRTRAAQHRPGGTMPGFKSRRKEQRFTCWYNGGRGFTVHRTGRSSGVVVIGGLNPVGKYEGRSRYWKLAIHFRMSADLVPTTSVQVDWLHRRVTFISTPPERTAPVTGAMAGIDAGVTRTVAVSDGTFYDMPDITATLQRRKSHQRAMARSKHRADAEHRDFRASSRYREHRRLAAQCSRHIANIRKEFAHQTSNALVRDFDLLVFENLNIPAMTRKGYGKRGLNRGILNSAWATTRDLCVDKANRTPGKTTALVNPGHTSQRCRMCGHIAAENRESQAVFRCVQCVQCGYTDNADTNASGNILDRKLLGWTSPAPRKRKTSTGDARAAATYDARTPALR